MTKTAVSTYREAWVVLSWCKKITTLAIQQTIFTGVLCVVFVPSLYALSLGPIEVKSNFGERFDAEIILTVEDDGNAKVRIGTLEDYQVLGLKRPDFLDELEIEPLLEGRAKTKLIKIISRPPMFYPSFNLVIRAENSGGVILETYLVAVDFQRNISIAAKAGDEKVESIAPQKPVAIVNDPATLVNEAKETIKEAIKEAKANQPPVTTPISPDKPIVKEPKESLLPPPVTPPVTSEKTAEKNVQVQSPPQEIVKPPKLSVDIRSPVKASKVYGPVKHGESLWQISQNIARGTLDVTHVAVAIWMDNLSKFVGGNINGIRAGEYLSLENLEKFIAQVSPTAAREIFYKQYQEWKHQSVPLQPATNQVATMVSLPETVPETAAILSLVEGWRKSWEEGALDRHMAYFSTKSSVGPSPYMVWREIKKRMFDRHKVVKISIEQPSISRKNNQWVAVFKQAFHSDKMDSWGQKNLYLTREESGWKIMNEQFVPLKREVKVEAKTPPVIDEADQRIRSGILSAVEDWRRSWEDGDFVRHIALFPKEPSGIKEKKQYEIWKNSKKQAFVRHNGVNISLSSLVLKKVKDRWVVTCDQTFRSDQLKTSGHKIFEFVREGSEWKIVNEDFVENK